MGLRASGGRLAIRLSFGTVAIACVNCCVMIGKVYAALIYILILLYVFSVAFLVADAACSKISCKSNGHLFQRKMWWSYEHVFLETMLCFFKHLNQIQICSRVCQAQLVLYFVCAVSQHFQVGVAFIFLVIEHGRFEKRSCCSVGIGEGQANKTQAPHRQIARS